MIRTYTVEWGHYTFNSKGDKVSEIQDGDRELTAESEDEAIKKANIPEDAEWHHAYVGTSKWL
jgi:hypothetical protein